METTNKFFLYINDCIYIYNQDFAIFRYKYKNISKQTNEDIKYEQ